MFENCFFKMNSQEINNLIDSDFEEYSDDSDDDPTWELSDNMNLSSKCLYIIIHNSQFLFYYTYFYITFVNESDSESKIIQTNRCLFSGNSN